MKYDWLLWLKIIIIHHIYYIYIYIYTVYVSSEKRNGSFVSTVWRFCLFMCFLPLNGFFLSSLLLVFFLKVSPVGLVTNAVTLSGDVRGILDHQTIICSKAAVLHVLKKPPEGRRLLLRGHDSTKTWEEDQRGPHHHFFLPTVNRTKWLLFFVSEDPPKEILIYLCYQSTTMHILIQIQCFMEINSW